jgi:uncharacterized membrane protein
MRLLRHLFARSARQLFPEEALEGIAEAIADGERRHRGEVVFAVESDLPVSAILAGLQPRERAEEVFVRLRVWDTQDNNGVLVYLLLADHRIEIVADRGLRNRVNDAQWRDVCGRLEEGMRAGRAMDAVMAGVRAVSDLLAEHFPRADGDSDEDELPNRPHMLD